MVWTNIDFSTFKLFSLIKPKQQHCIFTMNLLVVFFLHVHHFLPSHHRSIKTGVFFLFISIHLFFSFQFKVKWNFRCFFFSYALFLNVDSLYKHLLKSSPCIYLLKWLIYCDEKYFVIVTFDASEANAIYPYKFNLRNDSKKVHRFPINYRFELYVNYFSDNFNLEVQALLIEKIHDSFILICTGNQWKFIRWQWNYFILH